VIEIDKDHLAFATKRYNMGPMRVVRNLAGIDCLKSLAIGAMAIALSALPIQAQRGSAPSGGSGASRRSPGIGGPIRPFPPPLQPGVQPDPNGVIIPTPEQISKPVVVQDEACLPWDLPTGSGATVSAVRLAVPGKARNQYQKACGAFRKNHLSEAEQHARDAIEKYSNYSAAWVMLGKVLEEEQKLNEAHEACSQSIKVDPTYLPPYLCLAGLLSREKKWDDLLAWSDRFFGMNLTGDLYANYYRSLAFYRLHNLPEAQKSALAAIALDSEHHQPGLNFLLAQIYGEQRDLSGATVQIEQFVKYTRSRQDQNDAREYLSELRSQLSEK
jgi:tetratricopeptide (TPR) repeat protein